MSRPESATSPVAAGSPPVDDIPVTVVGGYLGSGKTTLVNHLLRTGGERMAVLVNDFGEIDIDAALIERDDGDTIALANGCICCSLVDGLATALDGIVALDPRPERVVIEASGVADPAAVAAYGHGPGLELDAVIVLVDAEQVRRLAADRYVGDTVTSQLRAADVLVVNKIDLLEPAEVDATRSWLEEQVDRAVTVTASQARVDPAVLFGRLDHQPGPAAAVPTGPAADEVFESWNWVGDGELDRARVERVMAELPDSVVRAKGVLRLVGEDGRLSVLQRVGGRWSLTPARPGVSVDRSRLVVIGLRGALTSDWLSDRLGPVAPPDDA